MQGLAAEGGTAFAFEAGSGGPFAPLPAPAPHPLPPPPPTPGAGRPTRGKRAVSRWHGSDGSWALACTEEDTYERLALEHAPHACADVHPLT